MTKAYLGLGSNLRSPIRQLRQAIKLLQKLPRSRIKNQSSIYMSHPMGVHAQPIFFNMVISIDTQLTPLELLRHCQSIEHQQHRIRKKHWGPRTIDIDLLLYGNAKINSKFLTIPHQEILKRDFVIIPLLEISPEVRLPTGKPLSHYQCHPRENHLLTSIDSR